MILKVKDWIKSSNRFTFNPYTLTATRLSDGKEFKWEEEVYSPIGFGEIMGFDDDNIHVFVYHKEADELAKIEIYALYLKDEWMNAGM